MIFQPWAFFIAIPPFLGIFLLFWKMKRESALKRDPFTEPLLRPPGESCRLKLDELVEKSITRILLFVAPIPVALSAYYAHVSIVTCIILLVLSFAFTLFMTKGLWEVAIKIRNYRLGFEGERAVGQEINQALSFGCKVYHDIQFEGYNIDHVIIAPSGVYAVETKTRRKGHEKNAHRVKYDGEKLIFPEWEDDYGLEQAQRNAKSLSVWLSKAVGESLWVEPILTLPGWLVDRLAKGKVNVLNPKEIVGFISRNSHIALSPQLIQRISHQIEQRNVIS
jgi:uncharacterized membrane protein